ncbi:MAG: DinB family protein [Candidatus Dormiibacterota bacterium]
MADKDLKAELHGDLQEAREALVWKLDGLSEYDIRRPMVPTGTNLLGLVKHVAIVDGGYFGVTFGRPLEEVQHWFGDDVEPNSDMWATADETREQIVGLYRRVWTHSDATIESLDLKAVGHVPWWGDSNQVTLERMLAYMIAETNRHTGHADIVRELIDGAVGWRKDDDSMAPGDRAWWQSFHARVERAALEAQKLATKSGGGAER